MAIPGICCNRKESNQTKSEKYSRWTKENAIVESYEK